MPKLQFTMYWGDEIVTVYGHTVEEAYKTLPERCRINDSGLPVPIEALKWTGYWRGYFAEDN